MNAEKLDKPLLQTIVSSLEPAFRKTDNGDSVMTYTMAAERKALRIRFSSCLRKKSVVGEGEG